MKILFRPQKPIDIVAAFYEMHCLIPDAKIIFVTNIRSPNKLLIWCMDCMGGGWFFETLQAPPLHAVSRTRRRPRRGKQHEEDEPIVNTCCSSPVATFKFNIRMRCYRRRSMYTVRPSVQRKIIIIIRWNNNNNKMTFSRPWMSVGRTRLLFLVARPSSPTRCPPVPAAASMIKYLSAAAACSARVQHSGSSSRYQWYCWTFAARQSPANHVPSTSFLERTAHGLLSLHTSVAPPPSVFVSTFQSSTHPCTMVSISKILRSTVVRNTSYLIVFDWARFGSSSLYRRRVLPVPFPSTLCSSRRSG